MIEKLIVNGGPKNKDLVDNLARQFSIRKIKVSAYHPQANRMIERGHLLLVDGLAKLQNEGEGN